MNIFEGSIPHNIIVNADDFGISGRVNNAIQDSFLKGYVNQTTIMVNMPDSEAAVEIARRYGFFDKVGLHLNFSDGMPLTEDIRSFTECCNASGSFCHKRFAMGILPLPSKLSTAIANETKAQVEKYLSMGFSLMHCDGHHHVHNRLPIAYIVLPILKEYGFKTIRNRYTPLIGFPRALRQRLKNMIFNHEKRFFHLTATELFGGWNKETMAALPAFLSAEIMVHPDYDANGNLIDVQDWCAFTGPRLRDLRNRLDAICEHFGK